jgi:hypothetical protein
MDTKVGQLFYEIVAKFDNNFSTNIKSSETSVKRLGTEMAESEKKSNSLGASLTKLAKGLGLLYLAKLAINFGKESVQAFANAQQSLLQFNNAQQNVAGTTKEQIEDLNKYILALEKKTTIDDKSIRQASQILAQDQISIENQKKLLEGIVNLSIANSKANGTEIDVAGTGKAIGLAFAEGNLGRLVKQNVAGITEAQKKLFETGTEAQRTAILMKILDDNAKGAGDTLANSFQGKINQAKDAVEDFKVALGRGLTLGFANLVDNLTVSADQFETTETRADKIGVAFIVLSGVISALIATFKTLVTGLKFVATAGLSAVGIFVGRAIDGFKNFGKAIGGVAESIGLLKDGKFKEAKEAFKEGFKFEYKATKLAIDTSADAFDRNSESIRKNGQEFVKAGESITNATEIYKGLKKDLDETTKAKDSLNKKTQQIREATEDEKKATEEAKKKLEDFNKTLVETIQASQKTSKELNENLSKAFKDFSKSIGDNLNETKERLAEIVVDAENKKKELLAKSDRTAEDEAQLKKIEATLQARVGFEERSAKQIADIKKRLSDAGLDPNALNIDSTAKSLEEQIKQERLNATLDEFTLFENTQNQKLIVLTNSFITETLLIKNKIDTQKKFEDETTAFLISENAKRTADIEIFAQNAIAKYGEMANSLRSVISLQNQAGQIKASASLPKFSAGGFVGSAGGEVHAGEFVVPANLVASNPDLINMLDKARNQTNNITINTQNTGGDLRSASEELLWRLGRI